MELILRNARIAGRDGGTTFDIGIDGGRIAAIEPKLAAEGRAIDLGWPAGRRRPSSRRISISTSRTFSTAARRKRAISKRRSAKSPRPRRTSPPRTSTPAPSARWSAASRTARCTCARISRSIPHRPAQPRRRAAADRPIQMGDRHRDLHLSAGGLAQQSGHRRIDGRGAQARRQAWSGPRPTRTSIPHGQIDRVFEMAREFDHRHRHASRLRADAGRHGSRSMSASCADKFKYGGRVAIGHVTKMSTAPPETFKARAQPHGGRGRGAHRAAVDRPLSDGPRT